MILAKTNPNESLDEHITWTLNIFNQIKKIYLKILSEDDWENIKKAVILHDIGKITDNFQDYIQKGRRKNFFRHEIYSAAFMYFSNPSYYNKNFFPIWAIISHHKPLTEYFFIENVGKNIDITTKRIDIEKFIEKFLHSEEQYKRVLINFTNFNLKDLSKFLNKVFKEHPKKLTHTDRIKYIFYKAILQTCDWLASSHTIPELTIDYNENYLIKVLRNKLIAEGKISGKQSLQFREFQLKSLKKTNIIAIAPTGSGKTEAALLWASLKENHSKILYLLPTRNTANAIFLRLQKYFGNNKVSVVHSSAYFYRKELDDYSHKNYLLDKVFYRDITVATVDQLLTIGYNVGFWELKTFNLLDAKIIIDELHIYQPFTLGLIISSLKYLSQNFHANFYLMSATMPQKLITVLQNELNIPEENIIIENELLEQAKNIYEIREKNIYDLIPEIVEASKEYRKILIVLNTVNEAINVYEKLSENISLKNLMCFHSRFTSVDRMNKEKRLLENETKNKPMILVATQVVEVSLDIDFDILFTENAPIDAIIQRAGRVNRKGKKNNTKVIIFKENEQTYYVYKFKEILSRTFEFFKENNSKKLTEKELRLSVDKVYENIDIQNDNEYKRALNLYNEIQQQYHYIKDVIPSDEKLYTRIGLETQEVIPLCFKQELEDKDVAEKIKYEISIRKIYCKKFSCIQDKDGFLYIDADYNSEKGLILKEKKMEFI